MEQQYLTTLLEAYTRGYEKRYNSKEDVPERKEHYFKVKDDRRNFYNKMLKLGILTGQNLALHMPLAARRASIVSTQRNMPN